MNILQPPAGLRLVTAWRTAEGWNLDDSLPPVLALAVDPDDLEVRYITPGSCDTLSDSIATRSGRDTPREVEWADALALPSGEVIDAQGRTYGSAEQWLAALGARDVAHQLHPKHEQRKETTDA